MLKGRNLGKTIGGVEVLSGFDINISPSKITCLIGPSGSGKSTALSCLSLLAQPSKGVVSVDQHEYSFENEIGSTDGFPYPLVTVVFQGLFLWPHLTNERNIRLPLENRDFDINEFDHLIDRLKIREILMKYPNECSGGEKQRVALARQILLNPKYLLLDEITSALDLETVNEVAQILVALKNKGVGILLVTHMINLAKSIADDFYFLDKGLLVESGPIQSLSCPQTKRLSTFLQIYS